VIDGERLEALYIPALTTGLRRGELLALRWQDIDLGSRQLLPPVAAVGRWQLLLPSPLLSAR
jgi:integrase